MTDPRGAVENLVVNDRYMSAVADGVTITYDATEEGGSASYGLAVTLSGNDYTISTVADGEGILGKLVDVKADGRCTVQIGGFMTLPGGTGATLTRMRKIVGALLVAAEGYIRSVDVSAATTTQIEELADARGMIIDPSTTTAVVVYLE